MSKESIGSKAASSDLLGDAAHVTDDDIRNAPKVRIRIHKTNDKSETPDVFVGVNGVNFLIQRGVDVEVPAPVLSVLEEAVRTVYESGPNEEGALIAREALAYPFTRL